MKKKAYVIVDAYGSGGKLVDIFKQKFNNNTEIAIIHVQGTPTPFSSMPPIAFEKYEENIVYTGDIQKLMAKLNEKYDVVAVLPGQEPGVELADILSEALSLESTNGTKKSTARRNKYEMIKTIAEAGLAAPKFIKSSSLTEIQNWVKEYPVVIKALRSAGTDGVYICKNSEELKTSAEKLLNSTSIYDEVNKEILVESFLKGKEYVVNSVSKGGKHYVTDVWMYEKKFISGHGNVYDREMLLPSHLPEVKELIEYNAKVLDALEINNGPSHAEIMYTPDQGPVLVEVGARISGVIHPGLYNSCIGHNQLDLTVDCYADSEKFMQTVSKFPYNMKQNGMIINLIYEGLPGKIEYINEDMVTKIKSLKSAVEVVIRVHEGDTLTPTRTLVNSPARVFLGHMDEKQLYEDYNAIQEMKGRLFSVRIQLTDRPPSPIIKSLIENKDTPVVEENSKAEVKSLLHNTM